MYMKIITFTDNRFETGKTAKNRFKVNLIIQPEMSKRKDRHFPFRVFSASIYSRFSVPLQSNQKIFPFRGIPRNAEYGTPKMKTEFRNFREKFFVKLFFECFFLIFYWFQLKNGWVKRY